MLPEGLVLRLGLEGFAGPCRSAFLQAEAGPVAARAIPPF